MEYSDSYLREFLPRFSPAIELVPSAVVRAFERRGEYIVDEPELIARSAFWTYALFSEMDLRQYRSEDLDYRWEVSPLLSTIHSGLGMQRISFGLFDMRREKPGIGFIFDVPEWSGPKFLIIDTLSFPRLGGVRFPLAIRQTRIEHHLDHPTGATSACWARCNRTLRWGVITAGHAFHGIRPGAGVTMTSGSTALLDRHYFQPIDAAFVHTVAPTYSPAPLPVEKFATMGLPVTVELKSGTTERTVVDVQHNCGVLNTREVGVTFCLDEPESPGDSGSLIRLRSGKALGIYRGAMSVPGAPSGSRGLAQNFEQAILALNVIPYL